MLKKNTLNLFNISIIIEDEEYREQKLFIQLIVDKKKKYYYKIHIETNQEELKYLENYFGNNWIEGVKGFRKHIISDNKYYLVYHEKKNLLEFITFDNSLFMNGKLINHTH